MSLIDERFIRLRQATIPIPVARPESIDGSSPKSEYIEWLSLLYPGKAGIFFSAGFLVEAKMASVIAAHLARKTILAGVLFWLVGFIFRDIYFAFNTR